MDTIKISLMDLIQAGNMGLMNAVKLYDGREGNTFSSYAYLSIARNIQLHISSSSFIYIPIEHHRLLFAIKKLKSELGNDVSDAIIMQELHITPVMLEKLKDNLLHQRTNIEDWNLLIDSVVDEGQDVIKDIERNELFNYFLKKIQRLKPTYQRLIYDRYVAGKSINEVAKDIGKSKQFVQQVSQKALRILQRMISEEKQFSKFIKKTRKE